jgi:hypothetical protein
MQMCGPSHFVGQPMVTKELQQGFLFWECSARGAFDHNTLSQLPRFHPCACPELHCAANTGRSNVTLFSARAKCKKRDARSSRGSEMLRQSMISCLAILMLLSLNMGSVGSMNMPGITPTSFADGETVSATLDLPTQSNSRASNIFFSRLFLSASRIASS